MKPRWICLIKDVVELLILCYSMSRREKGGTAMLNDEMIRDLINGLQAIFEQNILQIVVYGSVARQEETAESDIDVAIIIDNIQISSVRDKFIEWNSELDMKYNRVFSIVDIEKSQLDKWGNVLPFYKNIQEEGVVLWKAA